jgi:guanylate kinase
MYGTSKKAVRDVAEQNKICILDVDEQGVKALKETEFMPIYVFIKPPSIEELEKRLRGRGTESEESFQKRMATAKSAIQYADTPGVYDYVIGRVFTINQVVWISFLKDKNNVIDKKG